MNLFNNKKIDKYLIENFNFFDFFQYIKKNILIFVFLFIFFNISGFIVFYINEKNFKSKIKYEYKTELSLISIIDLIHKEDNFSNDYYSIIQSHSYVNKFLSDFSQNYAIDCISQKFIDDNNFQESNITIINKNLIRVYFINNLSNKKVFDNVIKECNSKFLKDFMNLYDDKLFSFIEFIKLKMNKKKEETQENLDLLEDLKKELLTIYEKNTVYDLISAKSFNYIFYLKKDLKNFESDIASLKNFNNYLSSNATTNFIRSKETDIKKISPGYSPSAYQIFLFFNLLLISIFVIFYIYNIKKDD